jgi:hypothetical protein
MQAMEYNYFQRFEPKISGGGYLISILSPIASGVSLTPQVSTNMATGTIAK